MQAGFMGPSLEWFAEATSRLAFTGSFLHAQQTVDALQQRLSSTPPTAPQRGDQIWLALQLGLGLAWCALLASRAPAASGVGATGPQVFVMLVSAGWLPSWALACWQVRHRRLRSLWFSDLLGAGLLILLACSLYLPLFFFNVVWFLPLALLPRGVLTELLVRRLPGS